MSEPQLPVWLAWLADSPLFQDAEQITSFYDALVRPGGTVTKVTVSSKDLTEASKQTSAKVGGEIGLSGFLALFPFLDAKLSAERTRTTEAKSTSEQGSQIELVPIDNPNRQLVQLSVYYYTSHRDRLRTATLMDGNLEGDWDHLDDKYIRGHPRPLLFLELGPRSKLVPMAMELETGETVTLFDQLQRRRPDGAIETPPSYPAADSDGEGSPQRVRYWKWFQDNFSSASAMQVVEAATRQGSQIQWIDYRLPIAHDGHTLHLHFAARGRFPTGVFAYSMIERGYDHGLKLVGTLKSEPGMNVLAAFEL